MADFVKLDLSVERLRAVGQQTRLGWIVPKPRLPEGSLVDASLVDKLAAPEPPWWVWIVLLAVLVGVLTAGALQVVADAGRQKGCDCPAEAAP